MLRIKKEIDLKELEKKGFEEKGYCYSKDIEQINYNDVHCSYKESRTYIIVSKSTRHILFGYSYKLKNTEESKNSIVSNGVCEYTTNLDILYDLITAGYVEKVEE